MISPTKGAESPSSKGTSPPYFSGWGIIFQYPPAWRLYSYGYGTGTTTFAYLSTSRLRNPCSKNPRTGVITHCDGTVVDRLPRDGVLVIWGMSGLGDPTGSLRAEKGKALTVGGQPAKLDVQRPGPRWRVPACDELTDAAIASPFTRHNVYFMSACFRGPHLSRTDARVRVLLRSVRFRQTQ